MSVPESTYWEPQHMQVGRSVIAVVDDDPPIVELLEEVLEDAGYEVRRVDTTAEVSGDVGKLAPDLVILDVHFGGRQSGWEVLKCLRANPTTTALPVILCTADSRSATRLVEQYEATPTWIVAKPFDLDILLATVASALS